MILKPKVELGETLKFRRGLNADDYPYPYTFAVSDRAIYVTKEQHFKNESWILERIPIGDVIEVALEAESRFRVIAISAAIIVFGGVLTYFSLRPILNDYPDARFHFAPLLFVVLGAIFPFLSARRRVLSVRSTNGNYAWKPKIVVNAKFGSIFLKFINRKQNREKILALQNDFVAACARAGIETKVDLQTSDVRLV